MSSVFLLQPTVVSGTRFAGSSSPNHSAQKNALSWKPELQTTRTALRVHCMKVYRYDNLFYVLDFLCLG